MIKGILTGGPMGPFSPLSHPHMVWARGHFKDRKSQSEMTKKGA